MTFYETLDSIMKQDFGGRGLLASLPASPLAAVSASLAHAKRAVLLTGFPVRMPDGSIPARRMDLPELPTSQQC